MNVGRALGRLAARAAAVGLMAGYVGLAVAADEPARPAVAAPAAAVPCETCAAGTAGAPCGKAGCATCGRLGRRLGGDAGGCNGNGCNPKKPLVGQLRPGACFGYFQTQWHRWEDVCPLPYQGVGQTDAPKNTPTTGPAGLGGAGGSAPANTGTLPGPGTTPKTTPPPGGGGIPGLPMTTPSGTVPPTNLNPQPLPPGGNKLPSIPMTSVVPDKFGR